MTNIYFEVNEEYINKIFYKGLKNELIDKYKDGYNNGYSDAIEQKTGHWIIVDNCEKFIAKCSECGRIEDSRMINEYPYCHCGAKMEVI